MGSDLISVIRSQGGLSEDLCRHYFKQILKALNYMHYKGVAHKDIKPDNIMVDCNNDVKLIDFGFASPIENCYSINHKRREGTVEYMTPEMNEGECYRAQDADLFSLGVVLYTMRTGMFPFDKATPTNMYYKELQKNKNEKFWKLAGKPDDYFSDEFKDLIK